MYTRVTRITWPDGEKNEGMDEAMQAVRDQIMPFAQQLEGFKGFFGIFPLSLQISWQNPGHEAV
jgi:hypothetical protein